MGAVDNGVAWLLQTTEIFRRGICAERSGYVEERQTDASLLQVLKRFSVM